VALAWTKGLSTTASRELVDELSGRGVTVLVLHDFDRPGLSILHTLGHDTERYRFRNKPRVLDLGLRLEDVRSLKLEGEEVEYRSKKNPREVMASRGATTDEMDFLVQRQVSEKLYRGRRVELNELTNQQFITFVERKLSEAGVRKVVPEEDRLREAFAWQWRQEKIRRAIEEAKRQAEEQVDKLPVPYPKNMVETVRKEIEGTPMSWRNRVAALALREAAQDEARRVP
jgi:hypothetical protein